MKFKDLKKGQKFSKIYVTTNGTSMTLYFTKHNSKLSTWDNCPWQYYGMNPNDEVTPIR